MWDGNASAFNEQEKIELVANVNLLHTDLSRMSEVYISPIYSNEQKYNDSSFRI